MEVLFALLLICEVWAMKSGLHLLEKSIIVSSHGMMGVLSPITGRVARVWVTWHQQALPWV